MDEGWFSRKKSADPYLTKVFSLNDVDERPYLTQCADGTEQERWQCSQNAIVDYTDRNFRVPRITGSRVEEGVVQVHIDRTGKATVYLTTAYPCGDEAFRMLKAWNQFIWTPASKDGKVVKTKVILRFRCTTDGVKMF